MDKLNQQQHPSLQSQMTLILGNNLINFISWNTKFRHVGGPTANTDFKLVDVPGLDYLSTDKDKDGKSFPRGEICFKGYGVF